MHSGIGLGAGGGSAGGVHSFVSTPVGAHVLIRAVMVKRAEHQAQLTIRSLR